MVSCSIASAGGIGFRFGESLPGRGGGCWDALVLGSVLSKGLFGNARTK